MDFPFVKEALASLFKRSSCDMYPVKPSEAAPNYRGRIVFHADRCVNCMLCERVCSGNAITHVIEKTEEGDRITRSFNLGSCTFCATCMDFCHDNAIEFTADYHMIATKEEDLIVSGTFIKKPPVRKPKPAAPAADGAKDKDAAPSAAVTRGREDGKPVQDPKTCVYCTICAKKCPVGALEVDRAEKSWKLDEDACIACGNCASVCPKKSIVCGVEQLEAPAGHERAPEAPAKSESAGAAAQEQAAAADNAAESAASEPEKQAEAPAEPAPPEPRDDGKPVQDPNKCVYCTICAKKCPVGALEVDRAEKTWKLDEDLCIGCGNCASVCPKQCIIL